MSDAEQMTGVESEPCNDCWLLTHSLDQEMRVLSGNNVWNAVRNLIWCKSVCLAMAEERWTLLKIDITYLTFLVSWIVKCLLILLLDEIVCSCSCFLCLCLWFFHRFCLCLWLLSLSLSLPLLLSLSFRYVYLCCCYMRQLWAHAVVQTYWWPSVWCRQPHYTPKYSVIHTKIPPTYPVNISFVKNTENSFS